MLTLTRYIAVNAALTAAIAVAVLTGAVWLAQSLRFVDWIVNRGLPVELFGAIALMLMPSLLAVILPIGLFVGVLFAYARLRAESELTAMRAAGVSPLRLAVPAALLGVIAAGAGWAINLWIMPASYREFKDLQAQIRNQYTSVLVQDGVFTDLGDGTTLYVRTRGADGTLAGIVVHDARDPARPVTLVAERGQIVATAAGPRVVMENGTRQEIDRSRGAASHLQFARYAVELGGRGQDPTIVRQREATERYLGELLDPADVPDARTRGAMMAEGHSRLAAPLHGLGFALIAVAALTCGAAGRRGQTLRLAIAAAAVAAAQGGGIALANLAARTPSAIPLIYLNALLPILLAGAALHWLTGARRPRETTPEPA